MADAILQIISREDARARGLKRFFTGVPCRGGHTDERNVSDGCCRTCCRVWHQKDHAANPEKLKLYRIKDKANHKAVVARWYREHKNAMCAKAVAWKKRNPEKVHLINQKQGKTESHKRITKLWRKNHPEKLRVQYQNKRAKRKKAEGKHTLKDVLRILEQQKGKCVNCARSVKDGYHVDHVMPLSKGGSNWPQNLQILCPPCNTKKNAKLPEEWARENGRLL